ncbi:outer membrane protein assembly factor BamE [Georhizobium profundi]|jgi:outer membrane protein assembly factor BamE (lipoprotein component of BamABCDE complex)|uniref:Outer membrane protein assembly factor BamE n=1 Tax=Georhizobium profundi TaxID=2341112 RepID=A0A3S9B624_9HYPH|nr:outer membrane protein assembly factor BamE [Georhizobium profundi]
MSLTRRYFKYGGTILRAGVAVVALSGAMVVSGCSTSEVLKQGYVLDEDTLALVPVGSSREQVLLSLGTPSTTATFDNDEVFYYISQTRSRPVAFMKPRLVDQRVLAVYFSSEGMVRQIANYTLQDGRVFDLISRTTPTGGRDLTFLGQLLAGPGEGGGAVPNPFGQTSDGNPY